MISVLIPTRHHLATLPRAIDSLRATAGGEIELIVGIDDDDAETIAWAKQRSDIVRRVAPRPDTLGAVANRLAAEARGDLLLGLADDMEILTPGWATAIEQVAARVAPNGEPFAYYLNDPTHPGFPSVWGVNRSWIKICGFAAAPWFPYWWADTWILEVGMASGRLFRVEVETAQIGGRGQTTGMREIAWWAAFFERTRPYRLELALKIARTVHPPDAYERLAAVMPEVGQGLANMQASMKIVERAASLEAALSPGEAPNERYLRAKAAAERFAP